MHISYNIINSSKEKFPQKKTLKNSSTWTLVWTTTTTTTKTKKTKKPVKSFSLCLHCTNISECERESEGGRERERERERVTAIWTRTPISVYLECSRLFLSKNDLFEKLFYLPIDQTFRQNDRKYISLI